MRVHKAIQASQSLLGNVANLEGKLFVRDFRCWLVEEDSPREIASQGSGVLIRQPGLGVELLRWLRVGGPIAQIDRVLVVGILDTSPVSAFPLMLRDLASLTVAAEGVEYKVPLDGIDKPSQFEIDGVEKSDYTASEKAMLMRKYQLQRNAW